MNNLTAEFFEDIEKIQNHSEDMEEALERLVESELFSKRALFFDNSWNVLCGYAEYRGRDVRKYDTDWYRELLSPALFLVVSEIPQAQWDNLREEDNNCTEYEYWHDCETYKYLCNAISTEIQRDLLDGLTLKQRRRLEKEREDEGDPPEPDFDTLVDEELDVEEEALNNILLDQVRGMVNDEEWEIITASHGDGPELAEKYGVTESAIRSRRQWVIERIRYELES